MKTLLAGATIIANLGLAPAMAQLNPYQTPGSASAAFQGYTTHGPDGDCRTAQTDTSTTAPNPYRNTGSASAALQGYTTTGAGTQLATARSGGNTFNWGDAGIGATGAIGAALTLIGLSLVAVRRRGRLAV